MSVRVREGGVKEYWLHTGTVHYNIMSAPVRLSPKITGLVEYALSHDDFLSNISLNVVHYIQIPRGPRGINFFRIAKIKLHQKKEEVTTVQKIYRCHTKVNLNLS